MNVGIPGTGLGSLFYAVSIIAMLAVELVRLLAGRGRRKELVLALRQSALLAGVVLSLIGLDFFFGQLQLTTLGQMLATQTGAAIPHVSSASVVDAFALTTVSIALGLLAALYVGLHGLRAGLFISDRLIRAFSR